MVKLASGDGGFRVSTDFEFKILIELLEMPFVKGRRRLHLAKRALSQRNKRRNTKSCDSYEFLHSEELIFVISRNDTRAESIPLWNSLSNQNFLNQPTYDNSFGEAHARAKHWNVRLGKLKIGNRKVSRIKVRLGKLETLYSKNLKCETSETKIFKVGNLRVEKF